MTFLAAVGMVLAAAVSGPLELVTGAQATAPGSQQSATAVPRLVPATGLVVQRILATCQGGGCNSRRVLAMCSWFST